VRNFATGIHFTQPSLDNFIYDETFAVTGKTLLNHLQYFQKQKALFESLLPKSHSIKKDEK